MINETFQRMLDKKDIIFEIFEYSRKRAALVGEDKVYDFSLGNPSVPSPECVGQTICHLTQTMDPLALHGYSPGMGNPLFKEAVARDLNTRYGTHYEARHIFPTLGAAGALAHAFRAVSNPGDEIITFAPCFSEYEPYTAGAEVHLTILPADTDTFQIDLDALSGALSEKTAAVLVNSPNNPSGVVFSTDTIDRLASLLRKKSEEFGHPVYLISDEPYRDILFKGTDSPYIASHYENTLTCYSFSKSLSLPGERIGYLAVYPECENADLILELCPQISRTIGMNGAPSLMQQTIAGICAETADLSVYETNMNILYEALPSYGYQCVKPGGTFYMFPRTPIPDSMVFCKKAMEKDLMLVPGDIFGCPGHFRIAYCVPTERVRASLPVFKALAEEYGH